MKIATFKSTAPDEKRVAITPDTARDYIKSGLQVTIESQAGDAAGYNDAQYQAAGVTIASNAVAALENADIIVALSPPDRTIRKKIKADAALVGLLAADLEHAQDYAKAGICAFAMELLPRITRAQNMDVLSSQSNLAGYRAVLEGVHAFARVVPMMVTAAGTIHPAKILVLGAGVAGLQAIATARRLGAIVSAFDVRPAVKEQVQSLGANFIEVAADDMPSAETTGGYAKEMSKEYQRRQSELIHQTAKEHDIIITTALIPGRPAPVLLPETIVQAMKPGSVIVDLAVASGGNCPLSQMHKITQAHGVTIIGYSNLPAHIANDASRLYARNLFHFVQLLLSADRTQLQFDHEDEIIRQTLLTYQGKMIHPLLKKEKHNDR